MVVVNVLDKRLHARFALNFLGVHAFGNSSGGTLDSTNESMGEFFVLITIEGKETSALEIQ